MTEHWRSVIGFPAYDVGDLGNVRRVLPARGATVGRILVQSLGGGRSGKYLQVTLRRAGRNHTKNVHVLVAVAWLGDRRGDGMTVDHVDDNTEHNPATNLRWVTGAENSAKGNAKRWTGREGGGEPSEERPDGVKPWDPSTGVTYSPPGQL